MLHWLNWFVFEWQDTPKPPETKKAKKPTVKYVDLPIVSATPSMSKSQLDGAHEVEASRLWAVCCDLYHYVLCSVQVNLNYQDQLEQEKADARNAVEEYVYNMREKLCELEEFITEEDKQSFSELLRKTEDWLYDEGEEQPKKVYVEKLVELRKCGDPVVLREKEFLERPSVFNELASAIIHYEKFLQAFDSGVCVLTWGGLEIENNITSVIWPPSPPIKEISGHYLECFLSHAGRAV